MWDVFFMKWKLRNFFLLSSDGFPIDSVLTYIFAPTTSLGGWCGVRRKTCSTTKRKAKEKKNCASCIKAKRDFSRFYFSSQFSFISSSLWNVYLFHFYFHFTLFSFFETLASLCRSFISLWSSDFVLFARKRCVVGRSSRLSEPHLMIIANRCAFSLLFYLNRIRNSQNELILFPPIVFYCIAKLPPKHRRRRSRSQQKRKEKWENFERFQIKSKCTLKKVPLSTTGGFCFAFNFSIFFLFKTACNSQIKTKWERI